jgi:hypothetical protein
MIQRSSLDDQGQAGDMEMIRQVEEMMNYVGHELSWIDSYDHELE